MKLSALLLHMVTGALALTVPAARDEVVPRRVCYDETPALYCYAGPNDTPQDVVASDVSYIAGYLRAYGRETRLGRLLTMTAANAPDCGEWLLYAHGTAAAVAKKIDMTYDSAVLFEEIANTIDGGTGSLRLPGIHRCQSFGGSYGVQVNTTAPAYLADTYVAAGYQPGGVIIKIVGHW